MSPDFEPGLRSVFNPDVAPQLFPWVRQLKEGNPTMTAEEALSKIPKVHDWGIASLALERAGFDVEEMLRRRIGVDQIRDGSM